MEDQVANFMEKAFEAADEALKRFEVPVGCIFVLNGEIIAEGRNRVNETKNACLHAEFVCLDQVLETHSREILPQIEVYVTVEPCIMCASMLEQINVKKIVYGAPNERFGGLGSVLNVLQDSEKPPEIIGGIQKERAIELLKQFYSGENPNAPVPRPKRQKVS